MELLPLVSTQEDNTFLDVHIILASTRQFGLRTVSKIPTSESQLHAVHFREPFGGSLHFLFLPPFRRPPQRSIIGQAVAHVGSYANKLCCAPGTTHNTHKHKHHNDLTCNKYCETS